MQQNTVYNWDGVVNIGGHQNGVVNMGGRYSNLIDSQAEIDVPVATYRCKRLKLYVFS